MTAGRADLYRRPTRVLSACDLLYFRHPNPLASQLPGLCVWKVSTKEDCVAVDPGSELAEVVPVELHVVMPVTQNPHQPTTEGSVLSARRCHLDLVPAAKPRYQGFRGIPRIRTRRPEVSIAAESPIRRGEPVKRFARQIEAAFTPGVVVTRDAMLIQDGLYHFHIREGPPAQQTRLDHGGRALNCHCHAIAGCRIAALVATVARDAFARLEIGNGAHRLQSEPVFV